MALHEEQLHNILVRLFYHSLLLFYPLLGLYSFACDPEAVGADALPDE